MRDRFGREIDYMRISVIDSCNLNCYYCNPQDNNKNCQAINILSVKKVLCIVRAATRLGITHFRLTGGEPLLHPQIDEMVSQIKKIPSVRSVSLTTNAVLLAQHAKQLKEAGIDSINVSLDTIDASEYEHITKKPLLDKVEHGIDAAIECGIRVKINVVLTPQTDVVALTRYASKKGTDIRFIEMMPIGYGSSFTGMSQEKIVSLLEERFGRLVPYEGEPLGNGPCKYYIVKGFQGKIGFISAISHKFCSECNRIRLTSQGYLKTCLQYTAGRDLREVLRNDGTDEELKEIIKEALSEKPDGHHFREKAKEDDTESLCMAQIGG